MRKYGRYAFLGVYLLVILVFVLRGFTIVREYSSFVKNVTIENSMGSYQLEAVQKAEKRVEDTEGAVMDFTVWGEKAGETITDREGEKKATAPVLTLYGSSELIIPYGKILQKEDKEGCLIGEKTAEELFGSHKVEGEAIQYNGQQFQIRGVLSSLEEILVIQKMENIEEELNRVTIRSQKGRRVVEIASLFEKDYGISGEALRWDFYQNLSWLAELIPGKWSDFDGWKSNLEEKKKEFVLLSQVEKSTLEVMYVAEIKKGFGYIVVAVVLSFGILMLFYSCKTQKNKIHYRYQSFLQ